MGVPGDNDKAERGKGGLSAMGGDETTHQGRAKGDGRVTATSAPLCFLKANCLGL